MALAVTTREHGHWLVLALVGDADFHTKTQLGAALNQAHTASRWLILDCGELEFCDSSFIGALVEAHQQTQDRGGALVVAAAQPQLERLLTLTGLDQVITLYPSVDEIIGS